MTMKLCRCGGFYRRGNYIFHTNSWIHQFYKSRGRAITEEEIRIIFNNININDGYDSDVSTDVPDNDN